MTSKAKELNTKFVVNENRNTNEMVLTWKKFMVSTKAFFFLNFFSLFVYRGYRKLDGVNMTIKIKLK